ncbi:MAG: hypothetical protein V1696_03660 [Candidatus Jorgensenbacteria bacterium]
MDTEIKKSILNSLLALATLFVTLVFWQSTGVIIIALFFIRLLMMGVERDRSALVIYIFTFLFGALSEALVVSVGSAWRYAVPQVIGIPWWLPFVWGNAGLFINRLGLLTRYILSRSK